MEWVMQYCNGNLDAEATYKT